MAYQLGNVPPDAPAWIVLEFRKLQEQQNAAVDGVVYRTLYAAPGRITEGLTVKAAAPWNPGGGDGLYQFRGGAWRFLG